MEQIKKSTLCQYCLGCNRLELKDFNGIMRCKDFITGVDNWQEKIRKELQKK